MNEKIMKQEATYDWLKDEVHCLNDEKKELRERIDKAIKYLKLFDENSTLIDHSVIKGALTILKGSDKDE